MGLQKFVDDWYLAQGKPCCAGCDWWRFHSAIIGDCTKSAPVPSDDRIGMLEITGCSLPIGAGHVITQRDHVCGEFLDTYEWPAK